MPTADPATLHALDRVRALHALGRFRAALEAAEPLCERHPGHIPLTAIRVSCLIRLARPSDAARVARRSLRHARAAEHRSVLSGLLIEAYTHTGQHEEAASVAAEELAQRPDDPSVLHAYARSLLQTGRADAAIDLLAPAVKRGPISVALAHAYAESARRTAEAPNAEAYARRALEQDASAPAEARAALHSQLALMLDEMGRDDEAFAHAQAAASLTPSRYNPEATRERAEFVRNTYTPAAVARAHRPPPPPGSPRPVLIVGMPRSGTTLTERIIAAHPRSAGAGELPDLARVIAPFPGRDTTIAPPQAVAEAAAEYRRSLARAVPAGSAPAVITDKMPANFWHLGSVAHALPDALVIHCRRDPADTCLSCFMQPLSAAHAYASDLPACADYFRHYLKVMDHARTLAADPGVGLRLLELDYEQTVADPDTQTRRILDFLGLDFDPACLRPHEGPAVAHTLSNNQVSRPIYRSAVHRHLRYASHIRPLLDALDGAAHPPIPSDQPSARLPSDPQTTGPARPAPAAKDPAP